MLASAAYQAFKSAPHGAVLIEDIEDPAPEPLPSCKLLPKIHIGHFNASISVPPGSDDARHAEGPEMLRTTLNGAVVTGPWR